MIMMMVMVMTIKIKIKMKITWPPPTEDALRSKPSQSHLSWVLSEIKLVLECCYLWLEHVEGHLIGPAPL